MKKEEEEVSNNNRNMQRRRAVKIFVVPMVYASILNY